MHLHSGAKHFANGDAAGSVPAVPAAASITCCRIAAAAASLDAAERRHKRTWHQMDGMGWDGRWKMGWDGMEDGMGWKMG
jgi:hypothetical protein